MEIQELTKIISQCLKNHPNAKSCVLFQSGKHIQIETDIEFFNLSICKLDSKAYKIKRR